MTARTRLAAREPDEAMRGRGTPAEFERRVPAEVAACQVDRVVTVEHAREEAGPVHQLERVVGLPDLERPVRQLDRGLGGSEARHLVTA